MLNMRGKLPESVASGLHRHTSLTLAAGDAPCRQTKRAPSGACMLHTKSVLSPRIVRHPRH